MPTIAIDAMGGDNAPVEIVHGGIDAANNGHKIVLVGDQGQIESILQSVGADLPVVHASETIEMTDDPAIAIREKRDASISVAARMIKSGDADAVVSAGSTGAALAASVFAIGRLKGVSRPAIASYFPSGSVVLDIGANLSCRASDLAQFAVMGAALARTHYALDRATVGLLNIGSEPGKGRVLEREAYELISAIPGIDFVGNVEGTDLAAARANVIVCDGYTGNVLLKTAEGTAKLVLKFILEGVAAPEYAEAVQTLTPAFMELRERLNPERAGGAHLLGVKGVVVVTHGSSSRLSISTAVETAAEAVAGGLPELIAAGLAENAGST
ncbi:MAG: phosphate acyltransferase PlsX [Acidimicrobiia bacterium]|nr:phosphate acyltransferase PlsX [Acidimicrobiia bacterium]